MKFRGLTSVLFGKGLQCSQVMGGPVQIFISAAKLSVCDFTGLAFTEGDLGASLVCVMSLVFTYFNPRQKIFGMDFFFSLKYTYS